MGSEMCIRDSHMSVGVVNFSSMGVNHFLSLQYFCVNRFSSEADQLPQDSFKSITKFSTNIPVQFQVIFSSNKHKSMSDYLVWFF